MDKTQLQIRRLKCTAKTWMIKALSLMFMSTNSAVESSSEKRAINGVSSVCTSPLPKGIGMGCLSPVGRASTGQYINLGSQAKNGDANISELLQRLDVQEYIRSVEEVLMF